MNRKSISIDVKARGSCITKNGSFMVSKMTATEDVESCQVEIGFVSKSLHRSLHAGATIDVNDLDAFCNAWLKARGIPAGTDLKTKELIVQDLQKAVESVSGAMKKLDGIKPS